MLYVYSGRPVKVLLPRLFVYMSVAGLGITKEYPWDKKALILFH